MAYLWYNSSSAVVGHDIMSAVLDRLFHPPTLSLKRGENRLQQVVTIADWPFTPQGKELGIRCFVG